MNKAAKNKFFEDVTIIDIAEEGKGVGKADDFVLFVEKAVPGDVVVVPQKIIGASLLWRNLLSTAQIASSIAITAAVAGI